jgi:hypothetical protein
MLGMEPNIGNIRPDPEEYLDLARTEALAVVDPVVRLEMLNAMISEGDHDMSGPALVALEALSVLSEDSPGAINAHQSQSATTLVKTCARQGLFAHAEQAMAMVERDHRAVIDCMTALLSAGYAGTDDRFLQLDITGALAEARRNREAPPATVFQYFDGLASYGQNLLNPVSDRGRLFADFLALEGGSAQRNYHYNSLASAYAANGHVDLAVAAKDRIEEAYWRGITGVEVARAAQKNGDYMLTESLLSGLHGLADAAALCDGSCGRPACEPAQDAKDIRVGMAPIVARQGDTVAARRLLGEYDPVFACRQALTYAELYGMEGLQVDRNSALFTLKDALVFSDADEAAGIVHAVSRADQRWNNVMPALETDDEAVPLIVWDLPGLYRQRRWPIESLAIENPSDEQRLAMELLGIGPGTDPTVPDRTRLRDRSWAVLAKLLATSAPLVARGIVSYIETPAERVRALVGMVKQEQE